MKKVICYLLVLLFYSSHLYSQRIARDTEQAGQSKEKILIPSEVIGNWLKMDGSNDWVYGIHENIAIIGHRFWNYESVNRKGKTIILNLKSGDQKRQLFVTPSNDSVCKIGYNKKATESFSRKETSLPQYSPIDEALKPFFHPGGSTHLQGYIKGYSPSAGFKTGIVYTENAVTSLDFPTVLTIYPDGRFEGDIPLDYPAIMFTRFKPETVAFYIEPQDTLTIFLDWKIQSDRDYATSQKVRYMGKTGKLNRDIIAISEKLPGNDHQNLSKTVATMTPDEFKAKQSEAYTRQQNEFTSLARQRSVSPRAEKILRNSLSVSNAMFLLSYVMYKKYNVASDPNNKVLNTPITPAFYDFLQQMPLNDETLLCSSSFSSFINRFEFAPPFDIDPAVLRLRPAITFQQYLEQAGITLTPEENALFGYVATSIEVTEENRKELEERAKEFSKIQEKYKTQLEAYQRKYVKNYTHIQTISRRNLITDSILKTYFNLSPNLVYDITKIRRLQTYVNGPLSRQEVDSVFKVIMAGITNPYLLECGENILKEFSPENKKATPLPAGKASEVFKQIVSPHKGKVLMVDFWATSCGPCRSGIINMKTLREEYKDKEVAFVFITDDDSSPEKHYNEFLPNIESGYKHRIPKDDYNYLRQLFRFNGIPRYVLLDKEGNLVNANFYPESGRQEFERLLKQ